MSDTAFNILDQVANNDNMTLLDALSKVQSQYNRGNITETEKVRLIGEIDEYYGNKIESRNVNGSIGGGGR